MSRVHALSRRASSEDLMREHEMCENFEEIEHQQLGEDGFDDAAKQIADIEAMLGLEDLAQFTVKTPQAWLNKDGRIMPRIQQKILATHAPAAVVLVRLVVGGVFLSEGFQKFLFPAEVGAGRFAKIGIPNPDLMAPFVGIVEIICGALILLGLLTRLAAIPLIVNMLVAIVSTKIPILIGYGFWGFSLRTLPYYGFWGLAHEARTDFAMLLCSAFLLIVGAGAWSIDARLSRNSVSTDE